MRNPIGAPINPPILYPVNPMRFLSWAPSNVSNNYIVPFVWVGCYNNDPVVAAQSIKDSLLKQGVKVLFLWQPLEHLLDNYTQYQIEQYPPSVTKFTNYFTAFFKELSKSVKPDYVILDFEGDAYDDRPFNPNDPTLHSRLQKEKQNINLGIRQAIYNPLYDSYGTIVPVINWCDSVCKNWSVANIDDWQFSEGYSVSGQSAWPIYMSQYGNFFNHYGFTKDILWNSFILNINNILACYGSVQTPWISHPSFPNNDTRKPANVCKWLWFKQIQILDAIGINTCLLWNGDSHLDDQYASDCLNIINNAKFQTAPPAPPFSPTRLSYDSDTVNINGFIVKYSDFIVELSKDHLVPNAHP